MIISERLDELQEMAENNRDDFLKKSNAWLECSKKLGYGLFDN